MSKGEVLIERVDGVVTATLNNPERRNAISHEMWDDLSALLSEIASTRQDDRVLVLRGSDGAFSSGSQLGGGAGRNALDVMRGIGDVCIKLFNLPVPTIAVVNGPAYGAGANLALACDFVLATQQATFCEIFSARAMSVDCGGSWLLPRLVGLHRAKELVFLAETLTAEQAHNLGLIGAPVDEQQLETVVGDLSQRLAAGPKLAYSLSKKLLNGSATTSFEAAIEAESHAQAINAHGPDMAEAISAFKERRTPNYRGAGRTTG